MYKWMCCNVTEEQELSSGKPTCITQVLMKHAVPSNSLGSPSSYRDPPYRQQSQDSAQDW